MAIKAIDHQESLHGCLSAYRHQEDLTRRLDNLEGEVFSQELVNEIVLWKVNRYAGLSPEILSAIDGLAPIAPGDHRQAGQVLEALLGVRGVDLAMASTLLRFRNPHAFQIIDRHAYRALSGERLRLYPETPLERKLELYFGYLDALREFAQATGIAFESLDRLLYQFDKEKNGRLDEGA